MRAELRQSNVLRGCRMGVRRTVRRGAGRRVIEVMCVVLIWHTDYSGVFVLFEHVCSFELVFILQLDTFA